MRRTIINKPIGVTPLEALSAWKKQHPAYADTPAAYAGRLDPMASGKLLVLLGDECKKQKKYTDLDKVYDIEVLLDVSTDTGDVLGMPDIADADTNPVDGAIKSTLRKHVGTKRLPYPAFSSKTVDGKPLFLYALSNTLHTITIPEHDEIIYKIRYRGITTVSKTDLARRIQSILATVPRSDEPSKTLGADFRQDEIRSRWDELFAALPDRTFSILSLRVSCGSGTYMRTLAGRIGESLGTKALALSIHRRGIGRYVPVLGVVGW